MPFDITHTFINPSSDLVTIPALHAALNPLLLVIVVVAVGISVGGFTTKYIFPFLQKLFARKLTPLQFIVMLAAFAGISLLFSDLYHIGLMLLLIDFFILAEFKNEILYPDRIKRTGYRQTSDQNNISSLNEPILKYPGSALHFSNTDIANALIKRFPYYRAVSDVNKERFIHRVQNFMADKTFFIHDESGFKEMPILISASAIQLTFGFQKYLLPYFKNIHVFPEEFFRANDLGICFLAGNVSGNNINLSWKHFLHGYEDGSDGQNVGLHELAHALYYQAMVVNRGIDEGFTESYDQFENHGNKVYDAEMHPVGGLYSDYANKNFQEFWAESAEIFFERPQQLKELYPELYGILTELFNQDPLNLQYIPLR